MSHGGDPKVVPLHDPARGRVGERSPKDPLYQVMVYRRAIREMSRGLSSPQRVLFLFIVDKTAGWGLLWEHFTARLIEHGDENHAGTRIGRRQATEHLKALKDRGLILIDRSRTDGLLIAVNHAWKPEEKPVLARPKRLAAVKATAQEGWGGEEGCAEIRATPPRKSAHPPGGNPRTFIEEHLEDRLEEPTPAPTASRPAGVSSETTLLPVPRKRQRPASIPAPSAPAEAPSLSGPSSLPPVAPAPLPSTGARRAMPDLLTPLVPPAERRAALPFGGLEGKATREGHARRQIAKPGALEITARKAYEETHAEVKGAMFVPWSKKQLGILNKVVIAKWSAGPETLHDFIDWCFREWPSLRRQGLHWMDDCPALPDIGTLIAGHKALIRAWNSRASREWVHNLDLGQKRRLQQLKRDEGLTHDAAVAQMMREDAKAEIMDKAEAVLVEAKRRERAGQIAFQQANRMKPFSDENRHPLSKNAQAERAAAAVPTPSVQPGSNPIDEFLAFKPDTFRED